MSFQNEKDGDRKRGSDPQKKIAGGKSGPGAGKKRPESPEVGQALRTVYQRTIEEQIPPEMLDLLGKLG